MQLATHQLSIDVEIGTMSNLFALSTLHKTFGVLFLELEHYLTIAHNLSGGISILVPLVESVSRNHITWMSTGS